MTSVAFTEVAQKTLSVLADHLDQEISDYASIDLAQDSITVEFDDRRVLLITLHNTLGQLWVSSPISGGTHFLYDAQKGIWIATKDQSLDLLYVLEQDLIQLTANPSIQLRPRI